MADPVTSDKNIGLLIMRHTQQFYREKLQGVENKNLPVFTVWPRHSTCLVASKTHPGRPAMSLIFGCREIKIRNTNQLSFKTHPGRLVPWYLPGRPPTSHSRSPEAWGETRQSHTNTVPSRLVGWWVVTNMGSLRPSRKIGFRQ